MEEKILNEMKSLNEKLLEASESYYQKDVEIMTNAEYDALYDKLVEMEEKYNFILPNSITQQVGSEVVSKLVKEKHKEKALSLDKTKDRDVLVSWLGENIGILSWKLDGLTVVATYKKGKLEKAVTRGNGEIGEVITHNAKFFAGLPQKIAYTGELVIRGEALMTYSEFERVNSLIADASAKYKNPRNLASGTIRQLDSSVCKERKINFKAFELVSFSEDILSSKPDTFENRFTFLKDQGFDVVEHIIVDKTTLKDEIENFSKRISSNDFPSDGLVLFYNDVAYGKSLGQTAKFPRNGMAFKWKDETADTVLREIVWQTSRTGLINPVAVFDEVELEGTTVSRATANNVSILKKLNLSVGSTIRVYKANMIIPTILENVKPVGSVVIPCTCPSCSKEAKILTSADGVETLNCLNTDCPARNIKRFSHFVSRDAMNIIGLSDQSLEKFIDLGFIKNFTDIYDISNYSEEIMSMEGFGKKSYDNLIASIEKSKQIHFFNFLYAVGIPNIGIATAKDMCKELNLNTEKDFLKLLDENFDFSSVNNIGEIINNSIYEWYADTAKKDEFVKLASKMDFVIESKTTSSNTLSGKTFVITGSVEHFANRDELKAKIEELGGKVAGSVSNKTSYLINNDVTSTSGKNKKAKELGVPIISEDEFLSMI